MENIHIILSCAATALGILITVITFAARFVKNDRAKKALDSLLQTGETLLGFVTEAETFTDYSSEQKKAYVIEKANLFADENGIELDAAAVEAKIEELAALIKE